MSQNISDFNLYKKKKEYNKENYYTPVFNAFMRNELTMQEKSFFIYICGFGEKCFQSQANICSDLNITGPTLRKLMKSLEEKNYIYIQRKYSHKTKEKATPIIFPMPVDENTGLLSQHSQQIIRYLQNTYPSDY
ncbi:hypothetical protein ACV3NL_04110 [Clostridium perfringens]|nr:helix-turn-helix domain-containing protein [Clostridium perfringens]MDK0602580.1 helix-turn-helix domain-containing protein [Clostridium perfringens]